jgi:hypothetical protein
MLWSIGPGILLPPPLGFLFRVGPWSKNCGLLLNDGTSFLLLNEGFLLLNDDSCVSEPGEEPASVGAASGDATASGAGASEARSVADAIGTATVSGVGNSEASAVGVANGDATASSAGESEAQSVGAATGDATASAAGDFDSPAAVGVANGSSTAEGAGDFLFEAPAVGGAPAGGVVGWSRWWRERKKKRKKTELEELEELLALVTAKIEKGPPKKANPKPVYIAPLKLEVDYTELDRLQGEILEVIQRVIEQELDEEEAILLLAA